mmetsp:Transcript_30366/g.100791  ORF Transcript_30366/g.100791 Transcript_30366/m.100791 type:complete len:236 (+) Transcript_30366:1461-2168(+)
MQRSARLRPGLACGACRCRRGCGEGAASGGGGHGASRHNQSPPAAHANSHVGKRHGEHVELRGQGIRQLGALPPHRDQVHGAGELAEGEQAVPVHVGEPPDVRQLRGRQPGPLQEVLRGSDVHGRLLRSRGRGRGRDVLVEDLAICLQLLGSRHPRQMLRVARRLLGRCRRQRRGQPRFCGGCHPSKRGLGGLGWKREQLGRQCLRQLKALPPTCDKVHGAHKLAEDEPTVPISV